MFSDRGGRTLVGDLFWLIPSLLIWLATLVWLGCVFLIGLPGMVFFPFERFQVYLHGATSWPVYFTGSRIRVQRDPLYDRTRVVCFMMNHTSALDACIGTGVVDVPMCGLENAAHLKMPGYGWLLRAANAIPVHKGAGRFAEVKTAFANRRDRGISILAFPEGHRTLDGHLREFRRGVFSIARDAGIPIVPIAVRGAFRMLPKGAVTTRPALIDVYVGAPIETEGLSNAQLDGLAARVYEVIEAWVERREQLGDRSSDPIPEKTPGSRTSEG